MYKLVRDRQLGDYVVREADGAFIPADPANADWAAYQAWLEAGNAPGTSAEPLEQKAPHP